MKLCPHCKALNDDSARYCEKCRYKLDNAEFVPNPKVKKTGTLGFIILVVVIAAAVFLAIFIPGIFYDKNKENFGKGFIEMLPAAQQAGQSPVSSVQRIYGLYE